MSKRTLNVKRRAPGRCNSAMRPLIISARPLSRRLAVEWNERGKPTKWANEDLRQSIAWDGVRFPTKWHDECKACVNSRNPKERSEKYCSKCRQDKRRSEFSPDERNIDGLHSFCKECRAKNEKAKYHEAQISLSA